MGSARMPMRFRGRPPPSSRGSLPCVPSADVHQHQQEDAPAIPLSPVRARQPRRVDTGQQMGHAHPVHDGTQPYRSIDFSGRSRLGGTTGVG